MRQRKHVGEVVETLMRFKNAKPRVVRVSYLQPHYMLPRHSKLVELWRAGMSCSWRI